MVSGFFVPSAATRVTFALPRTTGLRSDNLWSLDIFHTGKCYLHNSTLLFREQPPNGSLVRESRKLSQGWGRPVRANRQ